MVERICRLIEQAEEAPSLATLADFVGVSPFTLQRTFKAVMGLTPKAYASAQRARRLREGLRGSGTVTEASYAAGFGSSGRLYEQSDGLLGMRPSEFRAGGPATMICFASGECSLGAIVVAASSKGVCAILLGDDVNRLIADLQEQFAAAKLCVGDEEFDRWVAQAVSLVDEPQTGLGLPLDIRGTAFQQRVWQALREIPVGETASYSNIADRIGRPGAARAVARACASNPIAVAIPCHRVVRQDGSLSGYRWGVERKRSLLSRESASKKDQMAATGVLSE